MSKYYWDEYKNYLINKKDLIDSVKFYQSGCRVRKEIRNGVVEEWIASRRGKMLFSDIAIDRIKVVDLENNIFSEIIKHLKKYIHSVDVMYVMGLIKVNTEIDRVKPGIYSININDNELVMYKHVEERGKYEFEISLFIDIESAVLTNGRKGLIEGAIQVGEMQMLLTNILRNRKFIYQEVEVNENAYTYNLGVNVTKQLLSRVIGISKYDISE